MHNITISGYISKEKSACLRIALLNTVASLPTSGKWLTVIQGVILQKGCMIFNDAHS